MIACKSTWPSMNIIPSPVLNPSGVTTHTTSERDTEHIQYLYPITVDWSRTKYLGLILDWNQLQGYVDIAMRRYIIAALIKFLHILRRSQDAPQEWNTPTMGQKFNMPLPLVMPLYLLRRKGTP